MTSMTPTEDHMRAYRYHVESGMCDPCASVSAWPERMSLLTSICNGSACLSLMRAADVPHWVFKVAQPMPAPQRIKCADCGKKFTAERSTAKYCGTKCRQRARRKKAMSR